MKNKANVAIIILNWNGWRDTLDCVNSIHANSSSDIHEYVLVIDNGSTDDSVIRLGNHSGIDLISCDTNNGFAAGCNIGIRQALSLACDFILLLNNDTVVSPNWLTPFMHTFSIHQSVGVISPKIYYSEGENRIWYAGGKFKQPRIIGEMVGMNEIDIGQYDQERQTDFAVGCCMMVRSSIFENIGLFDERFFFYHEDVDFSIRTAEAGYQIWYQPKSHIYHKVSFSTAQDLSIRAYHEAESRIVFFNKYVRGFNAILVTYLELIRLMRIVLTSIPDRRLFVAKGYMQGLLSGLQRTREFRRN